MLDPATGWFEIAQYADDKHSISIASIVEQQWLARYPLPTQIIFDRGSEFTGHEFIEMVTKDYGIKKKLILAVEIHKQMQYKNVSTKLSVIYEIENNYLDKMDPWSWILSATAFAMICSTYHITLKALPGQLVFGRDMMT
jgi:hypothetical protein